MSAEHEQLRLSIGAYLLGALEPADRAEVAAHLDECPICAVELAELAGLPGLLGRLSPDEAEALGPAPAESLVRSTLGEIARVRRGRRTRWLAGAAAAIVLVAGGTATGIALSNSSQPAGISVSATDAATHVSGTAVLRASGAGTSIALRLDGVRPGLHCEMVAVGRDGHREVAGSWIADYSGQVAVSGTTAITLAQLAALKVVTSSGTLVTLTP